MPNEDIIAEVGDAQIYKAPQGLRFRIRDINVDAVTYQNYVWTLIAANAIGKRTIGRPTADAETAS